LPLGLVDMGHNGGMPRISAPTLAEHQAKRRSDVVSAAVSLLVISGPGSVTPAAVAASAGLARSSVYQYFPSSGALLAAAVEDAFRRTLEGLDTALAGATTPAEKISAYVDTALDGAIDGHRPMASLAGADLPPECQQRVVELHHELLAPLVAALADLGHADAEAQAALVNAVLVAAAGQVVRGESARSVHDRVRRFVLAAVSPR